MIYKLFFFGTVVGILFGGATRGVLRAAWAGWAAALLALPVWVLQTIKTVRLDLKGAAALTILGLLLSRPGSFRLPRLVLADFLLAGLIGAVLVSLQLNGFLKMTTPLDVLRAWALPYLVGRFFLDARRQLVDVVPVIAPLLMALAGLAVFEAFSKINLLASLTGQSFGLLEQGEGYRWGLKRAHVHCEHPIFLGLLLVLSLPWALEASRRAAAGGGPAWWRLLPIAVGAAVVCTVSRAAMAAYLGTVTVYLFFRLVPLRPAVFAALGAGGLALFLARDELYGVAERLLGKTGKPEMTVNVNGRMVPYTGSRHRQLLGEVYKDAIDQAGLFGYGPDQTDSRIPIHPETDQVFKSIDDHYTLFLIQHGRVGVAMFLAVAAITLWNFGRAAWFQGEPAAPLAGGMCAAFLCVTVMLKGVWFAPDFGAAWLFLAGLGARMALLRRAEPTPVGASEVSAGALRDLTGHPAWGRP